MDKMPKWADVILIPLISVLLALIVSGFVVLIIGENPVEAMQIMVRGRLRLRLWLGLHALLRHQLHLHRAGRRRGLPRAAVQHRR
jgi:ABC-type uncharacterized transport system permease subunit